MGREPVARSGLLAEREAAARVTVGHGPDESASAFALHADIPCLGASIYDVRSGWGRGSQKIRQKEQSQLICAIDTEGEGVKKFEKFADIILWKPPFSRGTREFSKISPFNVELSQKC